MVRPTQQSNTKRKRKNNDLIWARDGDHKNAQEHPAYILENCNEEDDNDTSTCDKVWVEWSSNGTVACIPKSRISTTGLSSRRSRRTTNNDTKQSSNELSTTSNKQKKRAPSRKRSKNGQSIPINDSTKSTNGSESNDNRFPNQILAEGCGISELNGTYSQLHTLGKYKIEYRKSGEWEGKEVAFSIHRAPRSAASRSEFADINKRLGLPWHWYIGINNGFVMRKIYKAANNTDIKLPPPVNGWKVMAEGIDPAPTIKYRYKTADDNINASISDIIKVKEETKVKEEMYGGETDDEEEDRKIAAVPTTVVSSSQMKKEEYDDDTDEDVVPDPVKSSQVKVKDEEGDTDEEGIAPDQVQSTRVKEETGEDTDTDEEGATPDPVNSAKVKEELYGKDTDDEGIAPDQVKSAQVKEVKTEEAGEDTDDEDSKIVTKPPVKREVDEDGDTNDGDDNSEADEEDSSDNDESISSAWDSDNEEYNETAKVYLWCEGCTAYQDGKEYTLLVLFPYNWYLFWKKLESCKTWGNLRKLCGGKRYYYDFEERYKLNHEWESDYDSDTCLESLTDNKKVCIHDDFDLEDHWSYGDLPSVGMFPPPLEQVMWKGAEYYKKRHGWMLDYGEVRNTWYSECWLIFKYEDKAKIFKKIEELGCTARHFPKLGEEFTSIFQM